MAKPTSFRWTKMSIWPGDGADPEDFVSKVCGFTAKRFSITLKTSDSEVPDCDNPDDPTWVERVGQALQSGFAGSGVMAAETFAFWRDWMLSGASKNVRIVIELNAIGYFAGAYLLTNFELTGNQGDGKVNVSIEAASDGPVTWTTGAP